MIKHNFDQLNFGQPTPCRFIRQFIKKHLQKNEYMNCLTYLSQIKQFCSMFWAIAWTFWIEANSGKMSLLNCMYGLNSGWTLWTLWEALRNWQFCDGGISNVLIGEAYNHFVTNNIGKNNWKIVIHKSTSHKRSRCYVQQFFLRQFFRFSSTIQE